MSWWTIALCWPLVAARLFAATNDELREAILSDDLPRIQRALTSGADANAIQEKLTPLMLAAERGNPETIRLLIAAGARSFWRSSKGKFAYQMAPSRSEARRILEEAHRKDPPDLALIGAAPPIEIFHVFSEILRVIERIPTKPRENFQYVQAIVQSTRWLMGRSRWGKPPEDYLSSLTSDLYALDSVAHQSSLPLLRAVAVDLELKKRDCQQRGPNAAGSNLDFRVITATFPSTPAPGWFVRYKHAISYWAEKAGHRPAQPEWERFNQPTNAVRKLVPGPYRMYVEHPVTRERSCAEWVPVSFQNNEITFIVPPPKNARCEEP